MSAQGGLIGLFRRLAARRSAGFRIRYETPAGGDGQQAAIFIGRDQWAALSCRGEETAVEFYQRPGGAPWRIPLGRVQAVLAEAEGRLKDKASKTG